jgi:hypothetical protein
MDRKKSLVILLAFVILIGSIFLLVGSRSNKNTNSSKNVTGQDIKPQPAPAGEGKEAPEKSLIQVFEETKKTEEKVMDNALGVIETIAEKTLTVKQILGTAVVNIDDSTKIEITDSKNQTILGKLADLKVGDSVKIIYDKTTKNAITVSVARGQVEEKKN